MRADQHSLFSIKDEHDAVAALASVMPLVRAAMNRVAEEHPTLSRDIIADLMTDLSRSAGVKVCRGNAKSIKTATLEKWLSPADRDHPPSVMALMAFCLATKSSAPLEPLLRVLGCEIMTVEDRKLVHYAKALIKRRDVNRELKKLEAEF